MPDTAADSPPLLLDARNLTKSYSGRTIVSDIDLKVGKGQIIGLLGPNGAGKTTSFYMITGIILPDTGSVHFDGVDITHLPMHKRAQHGLGYLPQEESIFRKLSVIDNLLAVLETRRDLNRKQRLERAEELLERFKITRVRKSMAITLSGGEKRRLAIARTLCTQPKLLMLDEPFAGIDPIAVEDIQHIVRELRDHDHISILITDHSVRETLSIVDRAILIHEGRVILEGASDELVNDPQARKYYLGEGFSM